MEGKKIVRNSELFDEYLSSRGITYKDVFYYLNGNGVTDYNDVLQKSGILVEENRLTYLGEKDFHGADNGQRTSAEKALDCVVGNIQEKLFCKDNYDFMTNDDATRLGTMKDTDITSKKLDLIHIPTKTEVEFKVNYSKTISDYGTVNYRHRDGHFKEFMRKGNIMIIYFPYLNKVAVFDKTNFKDPEMGKEKGAVKIWKENEPDKYGKIWDHISIWEGILYDYQMMKIGNSDISKKVSKIVEMRGF